MADDPIPLYDGELSGAEIIPDDHGDSATRTSRLPPIRANRRDPRKPCDRVHVCFSPSDPGGRNEHVECPMDDLSKGGCAIEFDRPLQLGVRGSIAYQTVGGRPVRVPFVIRYCGKLKAGRYRLGLQFDRHLDHQELRPATMRSGRDVALGIHLRKLKPLQADSDDAGDSGSNS